MRFRRTIARSCAVILAGLLLAWACPWDETLRAYLDAHFWLPYSKRFPDFATKNVRRTAEPYAGMTKGPDNTALARLRDAYQAISSGDMQTPAPASLAHALDAARADPSLTAREREEVELIDAKIEMRAEEADENSTLDGAQRKLTQFLRAARIPAFRSEARGWLAHIYYLQGNQTAAGKIYLDELNRNGSNLSRETMLNSLKLNYGYDGGPQLLAHLGDYFDTAARATFAIELATNPHWNEYADVRDSLKPEDAQHTYELIKSLLEKHSDLLKSANGAESLAVLGMRTALRMGDPPGALRIAKEVPTDAGAVREDPDFNWMLASAYFLTHDYASADGPLLNVFHSPRAMLTQKASAAYGLCGVYEKTGNAVEQIRYALWLRTESGRNPSSPPNGIADQTIYWAASGFDLGLLLDDEASIDDIATFLKQYPDMPDVRVVKYSLAVRLARENRYAEAAAIYSSINANRRAPRMKHLAALYAQTTRSDLSGPQLDEAKYDMAEYLSANPDRIYFNDILWDGFQRYALNASNDNRLTREERDRLTDGERKLQDDQDERWRAYLILKSVVGREGKTQMGRKAAVLAIRCLDGLSDRFGREEDIRKARRELSASLRLPR